MIPLAYMLTAFVPAEAAGAQEARVQAESQAPALLELCSSYLGQALHPLCLQATTIGTVVDSIYHVPGTWLDD